MIERPDSGGARATLPDRLPVCDPACPVCHPLCHQRVTLRVPADGRTSSVVLHGPDGAGFVPPVGYLLAGSIGVLDPLRAAAPRFGLCTALTFPLPPPPQ